MSDTIQVVRVDDVIAEGVGVLNGSILLVWDGQDWVPVDVIELTEEQRHWSSEGRGTLNDHRRRLVSEWEIVND